MEVPEPKDKTFTKDEVDPGRGKEYDFGANRHVKDVEVSQAGGGVDFGGGRHVSDADLREREKHGLI